MRRGIYLAVLGVVVLSAGVVTGVVGQVYPVRWDDGEAVLGAETYREAVLTVEGEVRTVMSSGAPRLWGRGRPGTVRHGKLGSLGEELCAEGAIRFGLSKAIVSWGSAADACPAGTWVCTLVERGTSPCNTLRNDGTRDGYRCAGEDADYLQDEHPGWVADARNEHSGWAVGEKGNTAGAATCYHIPVWCCS